MFFIVFHSLVIHTTLCAGAHDHVVYVVPYRYYRKHRSCDCIVQWILFSYISPLYILQLCMHQTVQTYLSYFLYDCISLTIHDHTTLYAGAHDHAVYAVPQTL